MALRLPGKVCVITGTGGSIDDNDFNMAYVDVDADGTTFCSSSANLSLPATATVVWAGLYWGGDSNNAARNQVKFSTPTAGYATLTASRLDATGTIYQGFIDVTSQVQNGGNGTYTTANVQSTAGSANHISAGLSAPPVLITARARSRGVRPQAVTIQMAGCSLCRMKRSATTKPAKPTTSGSNHPQPSSGASAARPRARIPKQSER